MAKLLELAEQFFPDGFKLTKTKYLGSKFEADYLAENKITTDADKKRVHEDFKKRFTVTIEFDFTGISFLEAANQLVSTTSFSKMLYNNELKGWNMETAEERCKDVYYCKLRELLDDRKTRAISEEEKTERFLTKQKKAGKTKAEMLADIDRIFGE